MTQQIIEAINAHAQFCMVGSWPEWLVHIYLGAHS